MIVWFIVAANLIVTGPIWFMSRELNRLRTMWEEAAQNNDRHLEEIRLLRGILEQRVADICELKKRSKLAVKMLTEASEEQDGDV